MDDLYTLQTLLEIVFIAALIVGVTNEKRVAEWEQKLFYKWRKKGGLKNDFQITRKTNGI